MLCFNLGARWNQIKTYLRTEEITAIFTTFCFLCYKEPSCYSLVLRFHSSATECAISFQKGGTTQKLFRLSLLCLTDLSFWLSDAFRLLNSNHVGRRGSSSQVRAALLLKCMVGTYFCWEWNHDVHAGVNFARSFVISFPPTLPNILASCASVNHSLFLCDVFQFCQQLCFVHVLFQSSNSTIFISAHAVARDFVWPILVHDSLDFLFPPKWLTYFWQHGCGWINW